MTNLSKNIKKYFTRKLLDLFTISIFIGALLLLMTVTSNWIILIGGLIVLFVGVHLLSKFLDKQMDRWIVPKMERKEHETYHLTGSVTDILIISVFVKLISNDNNFWQMAGFAAAIILIKEIIKWRKFLKDDDDDEIEEGDKRATEEKEEEQIQKNIEKTQDAEIERMEDAKKVITESYVDMAKEDVATTIAPAKTDDNPDIKEERKEEK